VFTNRLLRKILGPKGGEERRLRNEELYALYSLNIIRVIKSSRRLAWHIACVGERCIQGFGGED
jgi:hypothetical protein